MYERMCRVAGAGECIGRCMEDVLQDFMEDVLKNVWRMY